MNKKIIYYVWLLINLVCFSPSLQARAYKTPEEAKSYLKNHYNKACDYYSQKKWREAAPEFERVVYFFSDSEIAANAYFYLGVCYFEMKEYDFANLEFSNYLKVSEHPKFFEETIHYKFYIAEYFKLGGKKRYLTCRYCPKLACARSTALTIYDEIIMTVPNHEYAAASLYSKGCLLHSMEEYREGIEAFQTLIRRFPKHELTPEAYLSIAQSYCKLSCYEFQNPDLLALSELSVRKFKEDFPRDDRVEVAEGYVCRIKENYAKGLSDIGSFYERVGISRAAAIYYQSSIEEFPDTHVADLCRQRLKFLDCEDIENEEEEDLPTQADGPVEGLDILLSPTDLEMQNPSLDNLKS